MKKLLLILGVCLVAFSSCKKESSLSKESSGSNTEDWTVFTVGAGVPLSVQYDGCNNEYLYPSPFVFSLVQSEKGATSIISAFGGGLCLVNNVEALGKIEDFDALSYQREIVLYTGACVVEKCVNYRILYDDMPCTAYTAFIIEDWETNVMLGRYKLIQVKYPNGEIYPEPID
ncbi:MAG: hypothetical protein MJZ90_06760 [Bacteroidales bacterium]|nr:hypothetical protein [Bacteroidales bacterium]